MGIKRRWGSDPLFDSYEDFKFFVREMSLCEEMPEICRPRRVEHVAWDADDTIWRIDPFLTASLCRAPFVQVSENVLEGVVPFFSKKGEEIRCRISLHPEFRETLKELQSRGITSSIVSHNHPEPVEAIIEAFGLRSEFIEVLASLADRKEDMMRELFERENIAPEEVIFVDDANYNLSFAHYKLGILPLQMGTDILSPKEVLNYIKEAI